MAKSKPIHVFFSWQSDLPKKSNTNAIRNSLEEFKKGRSENIFIDEATRDKAGSPNIPQTILEKIGKADIFVADVTTINAKDSTTRKCPNPNVVFELGYAVQTLGWERVILLFNTKFGTLDDLPFDFDRHRVSEFEFPEKPSKQHKSNLNSLINKAIGTVISQDPKRPSELAGLSEEQLRYSRDARALEWILGEMHLPTIDDLLQRLPQSFPSAALHFFEGVKSIFYSSLFHLNDHELAEALEEFIASWDDALGYPGCYHQNVGGQLYIFTNPGDMPLPPEKEAAWGKIQLARNRMKKNYDQLLEKVRSDFPSIDLCETSKQAWEDYRRYNS